MTSTSMLWMEHFYLPLSRLCTWSDSLSPFHFVLFANCVVHAYYVVFFLCTCGCCPRRHGDQTFLVPPTFSFRTTRRSSMRRTSRKSRYLTQAVCKKKIFFDAPCICLSISRIRAKMGSSSETMSPASPGVDLTAGLLAVAS